MDHQNISLSATQKTNTFSIVGDGFWYIDATAADGVDTRIKVATKSGGIIPLKPGQHFRLPEDCDSWTISSMTGAEVFTGNIIIGNGDFGDSNINNKFVLDASFANEVTVVNAAGDPVPVSLGTGPIETMTAAMEYTNSYSTTAQTNVGLQLVAPAANVNGLELKLFNFIGGSGSSGTFTVLAKASAPASLTDGDIVCVFPYVGAGQAIEKTPNIKVPAGKGLYLYSDSSTAAIFKSALVKLL